MDLKKVPRWAWIAAALVAVGVWWYLHNHPSGSTAAPTSTDASPVDTASLGGTPAATDPGASGGASATPDYSQLQSDLEAQQQQFLGDFLANQQGASSAGISPADWFAFTEQLLSQVSATNPAPDNSAPAPAPVGPIAAAGIPVNGDGGGGAFTTATPTAAPRTATAPSLTVPVFGSPETQLATQHGAGGQPIRYYTYKKQVPLVGGQTLHFTKGRGYYAA